ncbi:MAG: heme-binding protein [Marinobacter sp.]|nr:heme-binding protein [Marinobacter sp.]
MPYAAKIGHLAEFQQELVGEWENQTLGKDSNGKSVGGEDNPLSYNIMPLPQVWDDDGYILKNFTYTERLKFNDDNDKNTLAIAAEAPNRGGLVTQNCRAVFYEQQVRFAEGPAKGNVVHVENGMWLWLPRFVQQDGPYPDDIDKEAVTDALSQPADMSIAKQIAVPHGNSILAIGRFDTVPDPKGKGTSPCQSTPRIKGAPVIPDAPFPYPLPEDAIDNAAPSPSLISALNVDERYTTLRDSLSDFQNPHPDLTQCPNRPLQEAVALIKPDFYMHWQVNTQPFPNDRLGGIVTNIPFQERVSDVTDYAADYWLLYKGKKKYLAYTQTILMAMTIRKKGCLQDDPGKRYIFPHVTCNTVTFTG